MRAMSAATQIADAYRAGVYLGEQLKPLMPEVVFLFTTIDYGDSADILEGLHDGLEHDCIVIGNSGDGVYETEGASDFGASALALSSDGAIQWQLHIGKNVSTDPILATRTALQYHQQTRLFFMISDFHADASLVESVLEHEIHVPVVGGFAADDQQWHKCALYANHEVLSDCVVALSATEDINFSIYVENSITPMGNIGIINQAQGNRIEMINDCPAMRFIEKETGKPVLRSDATSLMIINEHEQGIKRVRSIAQEIGHSDSALQLYGGIAVGQKVQVCLAQPDLMIEETYKLAALAAAENNIDPIAAIVVSCAGRKKILGTRLHHEITALTQHFGKLPLVGFPSLGEIGPLRTTHGYSDNLFHNMTYVLLLIGS
ncbi:hypothetical protein FK216_07175 [Moraxellaceae bacterium AER2_44_116]|nr:FIST C-terminal domain-containing protein [Moraxellaceae bacterium]TQC98070.1 hypothetical protein FK216_07175 [Moraxellaceae bacterium AER2_44_116]